MACTKNIRHKKNLSDFQKGFFYAFNFRTYALKAAES